MQRYAWSALDNAASHDRKLAVNIPFAAFMSVGKNDKHLPQDTAITCNFSSPF